MIGLLLSTVVGCYYYNNINEHPQLHCSLTAAATLLSGHHNKEDAIAELKVSN